MAHLEADELVVVESYLIDFLVFYHHTYLLRLVFDNAEMLSCNAERSAEHNAEIYMAVQTIKARNSASMPAITACFKKHQRTLNLSW